MAIPRFKDLRVGPRDRRRVSAADPAASRGRTRGRRVDDGPAELNEQVHPVDSAEESADIPLLTDVVQITGDTQAASDALVAPDHELESRVTEAVLQRLMRRSDDLLEVQLQKEMAPVMARLSATLGRELREPLEQMIRELVARAVIEELTRLRSEGAERNPTAPRVR